MQSLKQKVINSLGWSFSSQTIRQCLQFVITIILARILYPRDYGLMSMSNAFMNFITIFNEMGIRTTLIQKDDLNDDGYSTAFWVTLIIGASLSLLTFAISPLVGRFFDEPILTAIVAVSGIGFIINSINSVVYARLEKNMMFKIVSIVDIARTVLTGVASIVLALKGYGVWSLVFGTIIGQLLATPLPWMFVEWRPKYIFDRSVFLDIFRFGSKLTGATAVNYFARNADDIIIGKFVGAQGLGYYSLAYSLMLKPLYLISTNVGRVLLPALSSLKRDIEKTGLVYLKMIRYISLITFPMMTGLLFVADDFIVVVYGAKWAPVIPIFKVLCLLGGIQSIGTTVGNIYISQGRADLLFKYTLIFSLIFVLSFIIGVQWGVLGVAIAYTIASGGVWVWSHLVANRLINLSLRDFLKMLLPAASASLIMISILFIVKYLQVNIVNLTLIKHFALAEFIIIGVISYAAILYVMDSNIYKEIKNELMVRQ